MDIDNESIKEYILFQINRNIKNLYKRYLNLIEDLQEEHVVMLNKLSSKIDKETLKSVDYFDENKYNYTRKKILDLGNEIFREIEKNFDFLNIKIQNNKNEK
jgi:hypothetical protein